MTVILPDEYHALEALKKNHVHCVTEEDAEKEDIRALRIGILNIMPEAQTYEFSLLNPLGRSVLQIIPIWIKLRSHQYGSSNQGHLDRLYVYFDEVVKNNTLDGMIVTGAPVETLEYEQVRYWQEIKEILIQVRSNKIPVMGICWGGLALAYLLGLKKTNFPHKLFGVYETLNLDRSHRITGGLDDVFLLPQSRYSGIETEESEAAEKDGVIRLLCKTVITGEYPIFESTDRLMLMNLGHFEYSSDRFLEETLRDRGKSDVSDPVNFNLERPYNRWRGQRNEFFHQWVKFCHRKSQGSAW